MLSGLPAHHDITLLYVSIYIYIGISHPTAELAYHLNNAECSLAITHSTLEGQLSAAVNENGSRLPIHIMDHMIKLSGATADSLVEVSDDLPLG